MLTNDEKLLEAAYAFHNNSRGRKNGGYDFTYSVRGLNLRMTEFQATLLVAQMTRLDTQMKVREQNAAYLSGMFKDIPGLKPAKIYAGCTRNAYHLFMFRYDKEQFAGLTRAKFLRAMSAEGIPGSAGYQPLNKEPFLKNTLAAPGYQRLYGKDFPAQWVTRNQCPENDLLCEEGIFLTQNMLLGSRSDMEQIAEAARKIQSHARALTQQS
jgi:dTDP-4-amino-4,6-dideoxygalactose transaminase